MLYFLAIFRFLGIIVTVCIAFIFSILFSKILPVKIWARIVQLWAKMILFCSGIKIDKNNTPHSSFFKSNRMIIANHISWLDIPILYSIYWVGFVGRAEIKKWPIISTISKSGGTVFINRSNKRELVHINKTISEALANGKTVGLFPEGKTSDGKTILPFKSSLLEAAIISNSTITLAVIKYYNRDGKFAQEVSYSGNISLFQSVKSCLLLNGIRVKITILPEISAINFKSRETLSNYLFEQVQHEYYKENLNARTQSC